MSSRSSTCRKRKGKCRPRLHFLICIYAVPEIKLPEARDRRATDSCAVPYPRVYPLSRTPVWSPSRGVRFLALACNIIQRPRLILLIALGMCALYKASHSVPFLAFALFQHGRCRPATLAQGGRHVHAHHVVQLDGEHADGSEAVRQHGGAGADLVAHPEVWESRSAQFPISPTVWRHFFVLVRCAFLRLPEDASSIFVFPFLLSAIAPVLVAFKSQSTPALRREG